MSYPTEMEDGGGQSNKNLETRFMLVPSRICGQYLVLVGDGFRRLHIHVFSSCISLFRS
jgi:hypothetical protein